MSNQTSKKGLRRMSPFINGTAYCGMLLENPEKPQHFGPDLADGYGPYYESRDVDAEIERLTAGFEFAAEKLKDCIGERDRLVAALETIANTITSDARPIARQSLAGAAVETTRAPSAADGQGVQAVPRGNFVD